MELSPAPAPGADRSAIMAWRRETRAVLLERRTSLPLEDHGERSESVRRRLVQSFPMIRQGQVGIYWPYKREISLFPLANLVRAEGGQVSLPVVVEKKQPVQFRTWRPGDPLSAGAYGIMFPRDGAVVQPDTLIVALVGFDQANYRLGYGGGYYDRTLAAADPRPFTIGVGFELMRLESIRPLPHDIPMDVIVTEAGVYPRSGANGPGAGP